ncbi:Uncharacterised protein [Klebsiella pneumoniae]|uniref:hypothetical protein n=1 Tax=Klebsiella pneumoniae TaxID=573 RepID=UPI000E2BE6A7|nr:hypothetical protein [Klebsiella pneumoniae]SXG88507.1 Uncharacterised protein [Klebsiella pneumoniae]
MNDITELAQSLKAAADREMICQDGAETSEIWERTVTPENILALVEALEKAQGMEAYWKTQCRGITDHCEELQARIAELESRTVTVKLPQRLQPGADGWDDWYVHSDDEGEYLKFDDVLAMLTAAGIKVEAE